MLVCSRGHVSPLRHSCVSLQACPTSASAVRAISLMTHAYREEQCAPGVMFAPPCLRFDASCRPVTPLPSLFGFLSGHPSLHHPPHQRCQGSHGHHVTGGKAGGHCSRKEVEGFSNLGSDVVGRTQTHPLGAVRLRWCLVSGRRSGACVCAWDQRRGAAIDRGDNHQQTIASKQAPKCVLLSVHACWLLLVQASLHLVICTPLLSLTTVRQGPF